MKKGTKDTNKKHRLFCKLRDFLNPNIKLLEQEGILQGIVQKLLASQDTVIHTPLEGPWYLINEKMHYSVRIGCGTITVVNTVHTVSRDVPVGVTDLFRDMVEKTVKARVAELDSQILLGEKKILEAILTSSSKQS